MLGVLYFLLSCVTGIFFLRALPFRFTRTELVLAGMVSGIVLSSWITLLLVAIVGYTYGLGIVMTILLALSVFFLLRKPLWHQDAEPSISTNWKYLFFWGSIIGLVTLLCYLLSTHFISIENGEWYSGGYTWADLGLHMSLASSFAHATRLTLDFSLFHGTEIGYPFLVDFFTGMMVRLGTSWRLAFLLPSGVLLLGFVGLLLNFSFRLLKSIRAAWIHLAIILFSGSVWGFVIYLEDAWQKGWKVALTQDYSNLAGRNLNFANFLTSHLLPQRSYLMGITCFLVAMLMLLTWEKERKIAQAVVIGCFVGLLPLVHVYTFFIIVGVLGIFVAWITLDERGLPEGWWQALIAIVVLGGPQVVWQFSTSYHASFTHQQFGWMTPPDTSVLLFWLRNVGLAIPLVILSPFMVRKVPGRLIRTLMIMGIVLFLAGNVRIFQPNIWDNMKLFTYAYMFLMLPVAGWLASLSVISWWGWLPAGLILLSLTGTGIATVYRESAMPPYSFLDTDALALGDYMLANVPADSVILTSDEPHDPVALLGGYPIVMGYAGWIWSYGIDYGPRQEDVENMLAGNDNAGSLLQKYGVQYVVVSQSDRVNLYINDGYFLTHDQLMAQVGTWTIYKVIN